MSTNAFRVRLAVLAATLAFVSACGTTTGGIARTAPSVDGVSSTSTTVSGGHKFMSRQQGKRNAIATGHRTGKRGDPAMNYRPRTGTAFVHTVIDDHSRLAYAEICTGEKAATAIGVLQRAVAWFAEHGVTVERVLSDNGAAYRSKAWRLACAALNLTPQRSRPYRPQTNGKIERFHRTSPRAALMPDSTNQPNNVTSHCHAGCTSTITTDPTPPSEANHHTPH